MILDTPVTLDDGSILVIVRDDQGQEIGFNQTFPLED
jgi:hypothetical protein